MARIDGILMCFADAAVRLRDVSAARLMDDGRLKIMFQDGTEMTVGNGKAALREIALMSELCAKIGD
jgi:hypothetical protein